MNKTKNILGIILLLFCLSACLKQKEDDPPAPSPNPPSGARTYNWPNIADSAQGSLLNFYNPAGNYYQVSATNTAWTQYWPTAHVLDVLVDAYLRNPSPQLKTRMDNLMTGLLSRNGNTWINYYYDDMEWLALAALRAFDATGDVQYKTVLDILWADIKNGWSTDLGGGIWWRKDNLSKNTPSNMPAAILAARLYRKFNQPADLQWAINIYNWQKATLYESASGWVYDNIDRNGVKNTTWRFTYNQGTFLGAALELYMITGNATYLADAIAAADHTLNGPLTTNGILKDEGGGDGGLFKGVFVRYFTRLIVDGNLSQTKKSAYIAYIKANGEMLWNRASKSPVLFGTNWSNAPAASVELTTQLSGIMLCEAMAELRRLNLL
ncbi:MAG TPA: glycoside hydrolase family 76 protein [Flavisolibacter sp.]|nr:glycoside hydrolase family 76 protein [Flavisolibacter sp.]